MRLFIITLLGFLLPFYAFGESTGSTVTVHSPENRVALLELYTSQGCSSCPPAERWLSRLKASGISDQKIIPLAFHVTYWDYIGWRDRYGAARYDERQRKIASYQSQRRIYTPQFVLNGDDYRGYSRFGQDIIEVNAQPAVVNLTLNAKKNDLQKDVIDLSLEAASKSLLTKLEYTNLFIALYENNLSDDVDAGENEGEVLQHDYVIRQLHGPFKEPLTRGKVVISTALQLDAVFQPGQLGVVAFAQDVHTGEILQAVNLDLADLEKDRLILDSSVSG